MKIDRLIGIITILMRSDRVTAPELADRFEVSRRTINRDIEDICRAGIPIITVQGYRGGIYIENRYKIDRSLFTREELQSVFAGLKGIDSVSETAFLSNVADKLSDDSPGDSKDDIMVIDLASHYQKPLTEKIEIIKKAVKSKRIITFNYCYRKGEGKRSIEPYRLIFKWTSWYVWGYCTDRHEFRLFKLNRLWDIEMGSTFLQRELPNDEYGMRMYFGNADIHLKALFCSTERYRLIEEYGVGCYSEMGDGRFLFDRDFADYDNMREWIMSFGDRVEVLEPERLRRDIYEQAKNIVKKFEDR